MHICDGGPEVIKFSYQLQSVHCSLRHTFHPAPASHIPFTVYCLFRCVNCCFQLYVAAFSLKQKVMFMSQPSCLSACVFPLITFEQICTFL
jgi:hypothetical protein